jgi:hypothetical protein
VCCHDVRKLPAGPALPKSPSAVLRAFGGGFKSYRIVSSMSRVVFRWPLVPVTGRFESRRHCIDSRAVAPVVFEGAPRVDGARYPDGPESPRS